MRVAVVGAGNGGHAMAAELTLQGHEVALCTANPEKLRDLRERGGVGIVGVLGDQDVPVALATGEVAEAVRGADVVVLPVPGMMQERYLRATLPHVRSGQAVWLTPGNGGSLVADRILRELGGREVLLIETMTLPYAARMTGPAQVGISGRLTPRCAAFPAKRNEEALALVRQLYDVPPAQNVLDTALNNVNSMIHPLPALMNWGPIDARERMFSIYAEGMTEGVQKGVYALDAERLAVTAAVGLERAPLDHLYEEIGTGPIWRQSMGLGSADHFKDRFFTEDVPVGLVTIASVGREAGVDTPLIDATIALSDMLYETDFRAVGRTAGSLGLAGMSGAEMHEYLHEGSRVGAAAR